MAQKAESHDVWENDETRVEIPYSAAGVSTTLIMTSKFTGKMLLMDVGDGALRDLLLSGSTDFVNAVDMICFSHGHFDHMGGLHSLLGFMRMLGRTESLDILVPDGCVEVLNMVDAFKDAYRETTYFSIRIHRLKHGSGFDTDFFKLQAFEMEHFGLENPTEEDDLMPALGYRVRIGATTVAYTGDTRMCATAEELVRDAEVAIIEATREDIPDTPHRVHLTEEEARKLGGLAKEYLLVHRIPSIAKEWMAE